MSFDPFAFSRGEPKPESSPYAPLGPVPAGFPVEPHDGYGEEWSFGEHLSGPVRFLLKVRGVSMGGDGIHDGTWWLSKSIY